MQFFWLNLPIYTHNTQTQTEHTTECFILFFFFFICTLITTTSISYIYLLFSRNKITHWRLLTNTRTKLFIAIFSLNKWLYTEGKLLQDGKLLPLFESKFFPFIKQVCFRRAKVDNLWTSFAIFL